MNGPNSYSIFELCIDKYKLENPLEYHTLVSVDKFEISEISSAIHIFVWDYAQFGFSFNDYSAQLLLGGTYYTYKGYEDSRWDLIYSRKSDNIINDINRAKHILTNVLHIQVCKDYIEFAPLINYVTGFQHPSYSMNFVKHFDFNNRNEYSNRCNV